MSRARSLALFLAAAAATPVSPGKDDYLQGRSTRMFMLLGIGEASAIGAGLGFLAARGPFARAVELQALIWGALDAARAVRGLRQAKRDKASPPVPPTAAGDGDWSALRARNDSAHHRLAAIEAAVAVAGWALWAFGRRARWRGTGAGLALQTTVLAVFDLLAGLG